ncbi:MAG: UDP-N-acetylmuramoyl-tripeptide--D-alanyl-D-alanine ligase [Bacteroidales bacterium]|nr:UDP-N-acetylmuramoyl-tripeptide--D-alanyl-D-alanine ligase [Bacteroidales bacterium]
MENFATMHQMTTDLFQRVLNIFECSYDLTTDSRKVGKGSIFVGLKGENFDGNKFAQQAIDQGAALVIIDNKDYCINEKTLLVENSLVFLQKFANYYRKTLSIPFLAISGTNGKTTTKELVKAVLSKKFKVLATEGNLNNHIGVPLTLLKLRPETELAVIEMGASGLNDIKELCDIAEPTCGVLTNVGTAHIEGFGSVEGVLQAKTELYRYLNAVNGKVFVNNDDERLAKQQVGNKTTYAIHSDADMRARTIDNGEVYAEIEFEGETIKSNLVGSYNAYNILAALSIGRFFGVALKDMCEAIENYIPQNNRSEIKKTEKNTLILDCYNANPSSCHLAIQAFGKIAATDKRIYMGAMKELGKVSEQEHEFIAQTIKNMKLSQAIFVGEEYRTFAQGENIYWFANSLQAKDFLMQNTVENACILIKGSRATQMEILQDVL